MPKNVELSLTLSDGSVKKLPFTVPDGPQGEKGNQGNSAYNSWYALNTDILAFLSELKAVDVMSPQLLQKLIDETTLGLTFDDYLTNNSLREFYNELNDHTSLSVQDFLINSGLESSVLGFLGNAYAIEGYSLLPDLFNEVSVTNGDAFAQPESTIEDAYQVINFGKTRSQFLDITLPDAKLLKNSKYPQLSIESFFSSTKLKDVYIYKGFNNLSFVDSTNINQVNKYLDSRKSTDVNVAGLTAYGVNTVISQWITDNQQDWFNSVPLSMVAQNWVNSN